MFPMKLDEPVPPHIARCVVYPVKSAAGIALERAEVDDFGFRFDRRWMVVDPGGRFMTQREYPELALIRMAFAGERLVLSARGMPDLDLPLSPQDPGERELVTVWRDEVPAQPQGPRASTMVLECRWAPRPEGIQPPHRGAPQPQGPRASRWLSEALGTPCRLVFMPPDGERPVRVGGMDDSVPGARVGFADAFPFLLVTASAVDDLNARLADPVSADRFRPNIVVGGAAPHAEDDWSRIRIGDVEFDVVKPCSRCTTVTVDQETGRAGPEPLRTLATYRRRGNEVNFGQNLVHRSRGWLRVGDAVEVLGREV